MKLLTVVGAALLVGTLAIVCRADTPAVTNLDKALTLASKQGKLLFVQSGRPTCGNCQALRDYIAAGQVELPTNLFVYADVNIDERRTMQSFGKHFKVEGNTLPFVVVADSDGKQLAARSGFGTPAEFQELIKGAMKKAKKSTALKKATVDKPAATNAVPAAAQ